MKSTRGQGGLDVGNLSPRLVARILPDQGSVALNAALRDSLAVRPGVCAVANLYVPANVVDGDTIVIGADTFIVDIINTSTGSTCTGLATGTADPTTLTLNQAPALTIAAGDLLLIESEILKVVRKISSTVYVVARGRCGTTAATHANGTTVKQSDAAHATYIPIGLVTTLTPAVFGPALVDEFTNAATAGGEVCASKAPTENANFTAYALEVGQQILFKAIEPGVDVTATTEEFTASTDNVWGAATFTGGQDAAVLSSDIATRVPTAAEELVGQMHFAFPFTVREVIVQMVITATGQQVAFQGQVLKQYAESTDVALPGTVVTLRNVGAASTAYITGFAATNTVKVLAFE